MKHKKGSHSGGQSFNDRVAGGQGSHANLGPNRVEQEAVEHIERVERLEDRIKRAEKWMIYINGAIALFGLLSAVFLYLQWHQMHGQLEQDQRAWIAVKGIEAEKALPGKIGRLAVRFTNTGKTPATHANTSCDAKITTSDKTLGDYRYGANPTVIPPSGEVGCTLDLVASDATTQTAVASGTMQQYVFGAVTYDDVFGRAHWLTFCQLRGWADPTTWYFCPNGNDTGDGKPPNFLGPLK